MEKKAYVEERHGDYYKKMVLEEGEKTGEEFSNVHELKEGLARNAIVFMNGAVAMIVPAFIIGMAIAVFFLYWTIFR